MLLFIYILTLLPLVQHTISIHLMLLFILPDAWYFCFLNDFNTSHVTVYPFLYQLLSTINLFQYISCYCLSLRLCFCSFFLCISIHLMLLFIVVSIALYFLGIWNFNTSHVTVYHYSDAISWNKSDISIHLMLLFILYRH